MNFQKKDGFKKSQDNYFSTFFYQLVNKILFI